MNTKHLMNQQTRCVFYAYPTSTLGGKTGGWFAATYKNVLATEPVEMKFHNSKEEAVKYAKKTWPDYPWDKYRHCQ